MIAISRGIVPVILCGGAGTRLWPLSRHLLPKQFLPLVTGRTLLQDTALRAKEAAGDEFSDSPPIVVCNEAHRFLVQDQLAEIGIGARIVLEPAGRNTAAAVAVAAITASMANEAEDPVLLVLASDHAIRGVGAFNSAVRRAAEIAASGMLVTFGITATRPDSGFGYIERGDALPGDVGAFLVARFVEKPSEGKARSMIATGRVYWNSGMFAFGAQRVLEELRLFRPDILEAARAAIASATDDLGFLRLEKEAFLACPAEAIDRAVMERTSHAAVIPADFEWSDVGSWGALWDLAEKDAAGNATRGDVRLQDTKDSLIFGDRRLIATLGVEDMIIVDTDDALLVADRSRSQEVREVVEDLKRANRSEHLSHRRVYRPWGYYESIDTGEHFQVKRLLVKAGHALSLQMHRKRAEHWVVVSGRARVTRGEDTLYLEANQSTFIPAGTKHRLENVGEKPLQIIEVQSGSYLGEDDIERFEDRYGRG